jgi:hypothetical protein
MKAQDKTKITAAEMKFMRRSGKCTWEGCKRNGDIKQLRTETVLDSILKHKTKWKLVDRMQRDRLTKLLRIIKMAVFWDVAPRSLVAVSENLAASIIKVMR